MAATEPILRSGRLGVSFGKVNHTPRARQCLAIMRRTHASLSRQAGIDPKLVADQLGHGLGVNLDVYTVAALHKRHDAVEVLESALATAVRIESP
ncbi:MAG: hypothetical protein AUH86_25445 [Acidobacteria bacterium 13_1_40CM_4_58_4]|nr:MAG: hypothetical protein AUH86_25445 [Acidobacteria bacterium 13_1_40CM_4_58_4]